MIRWAISSIRQARCAFPERAPAFGSLQRLLTSGTNFIMRQFIIYLGLNAILIGFFTGCGGPQLVSVSGTVTYKKEPLKEGSILFHPEKGRPAQGKIVNGEILDVSTFKKGDGATPGPNKV